LVVCILQGIAPYYVYIVNCVPLFGGPGFAVSCPSERYFHTHLKPCNNSFKFVQFYWLTKSLFHRDHRKTSSFCLETCESYNIFYEVCNSYQQKELNLCTLPPLQMTDINLNAPYWGICGRWTKTVCFISLL